MREFYQKNIYGQWRFGEKVRYKMEKVATNEHAGTEGNPFFQIEEPKNAEAKYDLTISVEANQKEVSFHTKMYLPKAENRKDFVEKVPLIVCMHPIKPRDYALKNGYAIIELDTYQIASDDCKHHGCFYDLYPYGKNGEEQTGAIVIGVSRWGKATAVCGAFDERFTLTVPACSGAGGLALNTVVSEGKTYDFSEIGGPSEYTYGQNEPLSCLQSEAERGWFNDSFLQYQTMEEIPYEQYHLPVLACSKDRFYMIIAACMGEDWVNAPAMWECYKKASEMYAEKGLSDHMIVHFHKEGHAVIEEDMELLISYFNYMKYGIGEKPDMEKLHTTVFSK